MKKLLSLMVTILLAASAVFCAAASEGTNALDAFFALTGQKVEVNNPVKTNETYLSEIMAGAYAAAPADPAATAALAQELPYLSNIGSRDLAAYAAANGMSVSQVRNAYYRSLANVLKAEIATNPASEETYRNTQIILSLFLDKADTSQASKTSREAIRNSMTPAHADAIAADYRLPADFVEFVIMDDGWDDTLWDNDDDWRKTTGWDDSADDIAKGARDTQDSTAVAQMQEKLIALGYLNSKADGRFGDKTEAALVQFQRANGLPATGVYSDDDDKRMLSADVVARWNYDNSFDSSPDNSADNTVDNTADNSISSNSPDNSNNSPDDSPAPVRRTTSSSSRSSSPDNSPAYNSPDDSPDNSGGDDS